jgi:hypothetical protein
VPGAGNDGFGADLAGRLSSNERRAHSATTRNRTVYCLHWGDGLARPNERWSPGGTQTDGLSIICYGDPERGRWAVIETTPIEPLDPGTSFLRQTLVLTIGEDRDIKIRGGTSYVVPGGDRVA